MTRPPRRIEVHIGRLVLRGVDPRDRKAITAALVRDLTRQLARETPGARARRRTVVDEVAVAVRGTASGQRVGAAVARAVQEGMRR